MEHAWTDSQCIVGVEDTMTNLEIVLANLFACWLDYNITVQQQFYLLVYIYNIVTVRYLPTIGHTSVTSACIGFRLCQTA